MLELQSEPVLTPPLASATVILLRDGAEGLEVFLLERHAESDVLGGVFVFPGGKVDRDDVDWLDQLDLKMDELQRRLGEPDLSSKQAAMLHIAAVREVFEETGVLFAPVSGDIARDAWRRLREGPRFTELLEPTGVRLDTGQLRPWSRWITPLVPSMQRKRFDTRFFVARVPEGQTPTHDEHEATASIWLQPGTALQRYWDREIDLAPPQIMTLAQLTRLDDVASVLASADARQPPCIKPHPIELPGGRILCYPGDPEHPVAERAMAGPLRLYWRNRRFEPEQGTLAALLKD